MQYLLTLTYRDGEGPQEGTPEFDEEMKVWGALNEELKAAGQMVAASGLQARDRDDRARRRRHRRPVRGDQGDPLLLLHPRRRPTWTRRSRSRAGCRPAEYGSVTITATARASSWRER